MNRNLQNLTPHEACAIIEGFADHDHDEDDPSEEQRIIDAFQYLINTGVVWGLQGFYGRTAERLIESGACHPCNG